jgi:hypothetical protein
MSGYPVEVAQLGAAEKLSPFVHRKFSDWALEIVRIPDQDSVTPACHPHARATVARTRNTPFQIL